MTTTLRWLDARPWAVSLLALAAVAGGWELVGQGGLLPDYILSPSTILGDVVSLSRDGTIPPLLRESLRRSMTGLVIGASIGAVLGLVTGVSRRLGDFVDGPVIASYPIPKVAMFPAFAVILGFTDRTRILVIAFACFYPVYINAQAGTRGIDPNLLWVGANAEASKLRRFVDIVLPAALPSILVGLRIALALSFVVLFATESIGFGTGLGSSIFRARLDGNYPLLWSGIAVIAIIGFLADQLLAWVTRRLTRGQSAGAHHG